MKKLDRFDLSIIVIAALTTVFVMLFAAMYGLRHLADLQTELHTPKLDSWNMLASGDLYILSYPTVCVLSIAKGNATSAHAMAGAVSITCPSDSYIAIVAIVDYGVFCNSSTAYMGWSAVDGHYGYAYVYRAKALSCKLDYSPYNGCGESGISPAVYVVYVPN